MNKNILNILNVPIYCVILFSLFLSSCVTQRKLEYFQQKSGGQKEYSNAGLPDYKLKPNDDLYIQISSLDDVAAGISSSTGGAGNMNLGSMSPYGASVLAHKIDKSGFVELPVIGQVQVNGKTIGEVTIMIKEALKNVLNQPIVSVKLVNSYISVLGEVKTPGHFVYSEDKLTIFDAIGLAGDITDYGNRKRVILVRNENGNNIRREVNLLQSEILASDNYYIRPGDVIYVKPLRSKFWALRQFPFGIAISAVTTTILVLNYIHTNSN